MGVDGIAEVVGLVEVGCFDPFGRQESADALMPYSLEFACIEWVVGCAADAFCHHGADVYHVVGVVVLDDLGDGHVPVDVGEGLIVGGDLLDGFQSVVGVDECAGDEAWCAIGHDVNFLERWHLFVLPLLPIDLGHVAEVAVGEFWEEEVVGDDCWLLVNGALGFGVEFGPCGEVDGVFLPPLGAVGLFGDAV